MLREARAAVECGYDVDIVAMRRPGEPAREVDDGCRVFRLPITVGPRTAGRVAYEYVGFLTLATLWLLRAVVRPYDIVQVHNPPDFLLAAALVPKLRGSRRSCSTCTTSRRSCSRCISKACPVRSACSSASSGGLFGTPISSSP